MSAPLSKAEFVGRAADSQMRAAGIDPERASLCDRAFAVDQADAALEAVGAWELLVENKATNSLTVEMSTVILNPKVADFIPHGMVERVKNWLRTHGAAVMKAEGRQ